MRHRLIRTTHVAGLLAAVCLLPAMARGQVRDGAHLFSAGAVSDATAAIDRLKQQHGRGLFVETVASAPAGTGRDKAGLEDFTTKQANASGVNGVFVMVCMDPHFAQVKVGPNTLRHGDITESEAADLGATLRHDLGANNNDAALAAVVQGVDRAYTTHIPQAAGLQAPMTGHTSPAAPGGNVDAAQRDVPQSSTPAPSHPIANGLRMGGIGSLVCIGVALVIVFTLLRKLFQPEPGRRGRRVRRGWVRRWGRDAQLPDRRPDVRQHWWAGEYGCRRRRGWRLRPRPVGRAAGRGRGRVRDRQADAPQRPDRRRWGWRDGRRRG